MTRWYRQLLSVVYGAAVVAIALLAIKQGSGTITIFGTAAVSMLTLLLIFGVEVDRVQWGDRLVIDFGTDGTDDGGENNE
jgi:hypothetical protein